MDLTSRDQRPLSRRTLLAGGIGAGAAFVLAACSGDSADSAATPTSSPAGESTTAGTGASSSSTTAAAAPTTGAAAATTAAAPPTLVPTPACDDGDDPTPSQTEGPYFTPNSPVKASFLGDVSSGTRLALSGTVVTTACAPVAGALVDLWQADAAGVYDNSGYRLRGHQFADAQGAWSFETVVPGLYPGRTRHLHVKVQAPNGPVLTTQLYFPDEPGNASDGIFREECLLDVQAEGSGRRGTFTFVLDA